ncbi:MAG: hypothetical protein LBJ01_03040 [Tannerella sp.]|jgi:hypothetical protein|nr:hypothetical protein [Tannerella sp.]
MDYYIYLNVQPYLAAFLKKSYGDPVELERDSPESRIIREYISRTPDGVAPDMGGDSNLRIRIPCFREADPRVYNYMGISAKKALTESFDQLLEKCMIREIGSLENYRRGKISSQIYAWMEKHGIPDDATNWYTISQKYYRLRKKYVHSGIKV